MKRFVISILASLPMMAMADVTGVLESAVTEVVESDSVPSLDAVQIDSMANHHLKQVIEDEKKENMRKRGVVQVPLCFLAKSLENMSLCHAAYFCKGWENARGCRIEHAAAHAYGLDIIYEED